MISFRGIHKQGGEIDGAAVSASSTGASERGRGFIKRHFPAWNGMKADCKVALVECTGIQSQPFCLGM